MVRQTVLALLLLLAGYTAAWGAVGCDLNDPDRDVARLFPESTGYKTIYTSILKKGGEKLLSTVETRLGDKFHGIYETIDVPYTIYEIYANKKKIGYIHGVNQKGQFGGIQVFVVLDLEGTHKGLLYTEDDQPVCGKIARCEIRQAVYRSDPQGFRPLRRGFRKGLRQGRGHKESGPGGRGRFQGCTQGYEKEPYSHG